VNYTFVVIELQTALNTKQKQFKKSINVQHTVKLQKHLQNLYKITECMAITECLQIQPNKFPGDLQDTFMT